MAQWGNTDDAANSVSWSNTTLNVAGPSTALFANTTAEAFVANVAVGVFGVSTDEMAYANTAGTEADGVAHAGWNLRTEGTGGRAGRVQYETLVAMSSITGDAGRIAGEPSDDTEVPE